MDKDICIEITDTVTISTEEYAELVTSRAYLSVIMEAKNDASNLVLVDDVVDVVSRLVNPVITGCEQCSDAPEVETDAE